MSGATSQAVAAALSGAAAVTILCHVRPDPDTIGSGLSLGLALSRRGVDVEVAYSGTETLPAALRALPGADLLVAESDVVGHDTVVAVDAATAGRLGGLESVFTGAKCRVCIDHHASNAGFGDLDLVDAGADCTTVLVLEVLDALGVEIDADLATCLYAGLITDTGSFKWARPASFRVAARLIEAGVDAAAWSRRLLDSRPFNWFGMLAGVLASMKLDSRAADGHGVVYAVVPQAQLGDLSWDQAETVVDIVRTTEDAEVAAVFKEVAPQEWTVSLRSKEHVDLVPIARSLGGGGHTRASGYSDAGPIDDVVGRLLSAL